MYELYFQKFNEKVPLTLDEEEIIKTYLTPKKIRKKQYLLQEGDVCKVIAFVEKGSMRKYSVDVNGGEQIIQFAIEGWTISDLCSFLAGEPATYNIDALEDSELVLINRNAHDELIDRLPKYERYIRLQVTNAYLALQHRLNGVFSQTPEERYENFLKQYPVMAQRIPQYMIASHMGLTPETLSRIRRKVKDKT